MTPLRTQPPIPPGIVKLAALHGSSPYLFLILLDGLPYAELHARCPKAFASDLATWRRVNLPTLVRSQVRYFVRHKDLALTEVRP